MRMELIGGAYAPRSVIANAQKCINLYPEPNRADGPRTMTHYQRPGLHARSVPPVSGAGRGLYVGSNGVLYAVVGPRLYYITPNWQWNQIGLLTSPVNTLVSMVDNRINLVIVDGSNTGYSVVLASNSNFGPIVDPTATFNGALKVDYIDTFIVWNFPGTNQFGSTLSNELTFDNTYIAAKTGWNDNLSTLIVNAHELLLIGTRKTELWYDAGNSLFPFAALPGAYVEWGCIAPRSVAAADTNVYFLAQGLPGVGLVIRQRRYETKVISNYAISYAINQMRRNGADLSDAVGYTYTAEGHIFYVLVFQSGNQTWIFDESIEDPKLAWHQECWSDKNGNLNRSRGISQAYFNGVPIVQDWQNGTIYELDSDYYFDDVNDGTGNGVVQMPISYMRTFPQILQGSMANGQPVLADDKAIRIKKFVADFECGNGPVDINGLPPQISLRVSYDRGVTYNNAVLQSTGEPGEYATSPKWNSPGFGRYPVIELSYSFAGKAALNGGWIDAEVAVL